MSDTNSFKGKVIWSGFFLRLFFLIFFLMIGYGGLLLFNLNNNINKTTFPDNSQKSTPIANIATLAKSAINKDKIKPKGAENNRINILLLGIGGTEHKGKYLTDTIALVSINPKTYQSAILSIPRDLYVQIPNSNYHTKINALYTYGLRNKELSSKDSVRLITESVEEITNETIPYYIILDFNGFKKIIETLEGVNITVENDIYDSHYPGPNYSYQTFQISKGFHHLDAETALKYARVRHTKGGDFGRAHRQQQIIASAREKALSLKILANPSKTITLLNALGDHLRTNIPLEEVPFMIALIKNINIHQATTKVLDAWSKDSLLRSTHVPLGGISAYVLRPKAKNYSQIHLLSKNIFNLNKLEEFQEKISNEKAQIMLLSSNYITFESFKNTLLRWHYKAIAPYNEFLYKTYCPKNQDALLSYTAKEKIFTLDDLAGKLDIKVTYLNQSNDTNTNNQSTKKETSYDIILCISNSTAKYFDIQDKSAISQFTHLQEVLGEDGKVFINK